LEVGLCVSYDAEVVDLIQGQQTQDQERADWGVAPAMEVDAARVIDRLERGAVFGERIQFRSTASKLHRGWGTDGGLEVRVIVDFAV